MSGAVTKIASGGGTEVVRLSHFNIGSHTLHPEHLAFLQSSVAPVLNGGGSILLMGMASRSGSAATNQALSQRRNDEVLKKLRSMVKTNFKINQSTAVGEEAARDAKVADGKEDPYWRAVQIVYWGNPEPPPPPSPAPPTDAIDVTALAQMLDLEEHELNRLFNQYGWTIDGALNVVGLIGEFAPIAVGAAEVIGVGGLLLGTISSLVGFFAYMARLDQEDGIRFGTWAACYLVGDWAVRPRAKFSEFSMFSPTFPELWVENNFRVAGKHNYPNFRRAWNDGAEKMRQNMLAMLTRQYANYSAKGGRANVYDFENLVKVLLIRDLKLTRYGEDALGAGVANHVYLLLRPKIEQAYNMTIYLKLLPYPSTALNTYPGNN
jgi:hypothetical protein